MNIWQVRRKLVDAHLSGCISRIPLISLTSLFSTWDEVANWWDRNPTLLSDHDADRFTHPTPSTGIGADRMKQYVVRPEIGALYMPLWAFLAECDHIAFEHNNPESRYLYSLALQPINGPGNATILSSLPPDLFALRMLHHHGVHYPDQLGGASIRVTCDEIKAGSLLINLTNVLNISLQGLASDNTGSVVQYPRLTLASQTDRQAALATA